MKSKSKSNGSDAAARGKKQRGTHLEALARQQGVGPVEDPETLAGDFWPENEKLDDFLTALRSWRREGREVE